MPASSIQAIIDKCGIPKGDAERYWKEAVQSAKDQGFKESDDSFYPYVMGIVKKRIGPECVDKLGWEPISAILSLHDEGEFIMASGKFAVMSTAFRNGGMIPLKYTMIGENISPNFKILNLPEGTKTLKILMKDITKPFIHWDCWAKPTDFLPDNFSKTGGKKIIKQFKNDFNLFIYSGPEPPEGEIHTYQFYFLAVGELGLQLANTKYHGKFSFEGQKLTTIKEK